MGTDLNRKETTMTRTSSRWQQAPALAVSLVALFAAITGAAAALPGTQTVNSGDIKNENVKSIDLKDGAAVQGSDVIDASLLGVDVKDGEIASADVTDDSITSADVKAQTLTSADVQDNSLTSADVQDNSLTGTDVQNDSLTGNDVAENTLGQVPNAATLNGSGPGAFLSSSTYRREAAAAAGTALGDGTFVIEQACDAGDKVLSGGPANVQPTSDMVESFATSTSPWKVRIHKNGANDNFSVVVLCANQ